MSATVSEGGSVTTVNVLVNDSDVDSTLTAASIASFSQGTNGSVVYNGDGTFTYTHNGSETTADSFTYTIDDGSGGTATATVNITVNAVNDAPVANECLGYNRGRWHGDAEPDEQHTSPIRQYQPYLLCLKRYERHFPGEYWHGLGGRAELHQRAACVGRARPPARRTSRSIALATGRSIAPPSKAR